MNKFNIDGPWERGLPLMALAVVDTIQAFPHGSLSGYPDATLRGPGTVWVQSLPFSRMAERIPSAARGSGRKEEGSIHDLCMTAEQRFSRLLENRCSVFCMLKQRRGRNDRRKSVSVQTTAIGTTVCSRSVHTLWKFDYPGLCCIYYLAKPIL